MFQCLSNSKQLGVDEGFRSDKLSGLLTNKNRKNTFETSHSKHFNKTIQLKDNTLRTEEVTRKGTTVDHGQIGHSSDKDPWCEFNYDIILEIFS